MIKYKKLIELIEENNKHKKTKKSKTKFRPYDQKLNYTPAKNAKVILNVDNIVKTFNAKSKKRKQRVLKGINLNIYDQDHIALIGVNGAGKTTLIEILSGLINPTSGSLHFGYSYAYSPFEKVGAQFQNSHYPNGLSVKNIIDFMSTTRRNITIHPAEKEMLIKKFGIKNLLNREANGLSGGQRQRLNILLALIVAPKLVFLDELTTGLDVYSQKEILKCIKDYAKKHNITMVSI